MDIICKESSYLNFNNIVVDENTTLPNIPYYVNRNPEISRFHAPNESPYLLFKNIPVQYLNRIDNTFYLNRTGRPAPEHSGQSPGSKTGVGKARIDPHEIEMANLYLNNIVFINKFPEKIPQIPLGNDKELHIGILDTSCSENLIKHIEERNLNIHITNVSGSSSTNSDHGDAVLITFLEELGKVEGIKFKKVNIHIYDVSEIIGLNQIISLFHVLNALSHINHHNNQISHINMSFLFNEFSPWLFEEMETFNGPITCAVGNNNRAIQKDSDHTYFPYPATYNAKNVYPVLGHGINPFKIWQSTNGPGSNYPFSKNDKSHYAAQAVFDLRACDYNGLQKLNYDGGTSFAAPRVMAQLIAQQNGIGSFQLKDIKLKESKISSVQAQIYQYPNTE